MVCTFSKKMPTGADGSTTVHQLPSALPDMVLFRYILSTWLLLGLAASWHDRAALPDGLDQVNPEQPSVLLHNFSAPATVVLTVTISDPARRAPFLTIHSAVPALGSVSFSSWSVPGTMCSVTSAQYPMNRCGDLTIVL